MTTLHSFTGPDGWQPFALVRRADGTLYGTSRVGGDGFGTVYRIAADGTLLITAVGTRRVAIVVHDANGEHLAISEGRPGLAMADDGSPFSPDGKKLYYLQLPRTSNSVGGTGLANYDAGELRQFEIETGQTEAVFPGISVNSFSLARDGNRIAVASQDKEGSRLWVGSLDRTRMQRVLDGAVDPEDLKELYEGDDVVVEFGSERKLAA